MLILPKANPLKEHIPANKIVLPDVLKKLASESFTGYINHSISGLNSYCLFSSGKMVSIICENNVQKAVGFEAISLVFNRIIENGGEISIYRMTPDMVMCAHALLDGDIIYDRQEVRQLDIKAVLGELKEHRLNGVVRFSTSDRHAMIFYKNGNPIGFYHNGASAIDSSPEESRKVAALPGATIDVFSTQTTEEVTRYDLLHMLDLDKLWEKICKNFVSSQIDDETASQPATDTVKQTQKLEELIEDLQEVAAAYLSRPGRAIIEKRLIDSGGSNVLFEKSGIETFLELVKQDAHEIDSHARIDEMIELMRSEISDRFSNL